MSEAGQTGAWGGAGRADGEETSSAKQKVAGAAQAVKQEAASFAADAKDKAADKIETGKGVAAEAMTDFAQAIRVAGQELSKADQSVAGRMVGRAAESLEGVARSVSNKRPEELLDAVRDFGRQNPVALVAGSVLLGVALGRFLRSSGDTGSDSMNTSGVTSGAMTGGASRLVGSEAPQDQARRMEGDLSTASAEGRTETLPGAWSGTPSTFDPEV